MDLMIENRGQIENILVAIDVNSAIMLQWKGSQCEINISLWE